MTDPSGHLYAGGDFYLSGKKYLTAYVAQYDLTTGISDLNKESHWEAYPNPAFG